MSEIRFIAEWIEDVYVDENGELDVDRTEYGQQICSSYKEAERVAIINAERARVLPEWDRIIEQEHTRHGWIDVRRWVEGQQID